MEDQLYKEIILDLNRNPHNKKELEDFDVSAREQNPLCGDDIEVRIKLTDGCVVDIGHTGTGCAISQASASLVTDKIKGMKRDEILRIPTTDVTNMLGIAISFSRMKCATLGHTAICKALSQNI